jgi:GNAT superfamily N-acetyltransferase
MQSQQRVERAHIEHRAGGYLVSTDAARLDLRVIHGFLTACYWSPGIPIETVSRAIRNSLCFGAYTDDAAGPQVGFARIISDFATYAYLCDVFVLEPYRGRGVSKLLMEAVIAHPDLRGLRRLCLFTRDAHGLYTRFGFKPMPDPARYLERTVPAAELCGEGASDTSRPA